MVKIEKPRNNTVAGGPPSQIADGSPAAPSLAFASDPDTGIYHAAANEMALVAGGSDGLSVKAPPTVLGMLGQAQLKSGANNFSAADYTTNFTLNYPTNAGWAITPIGALAFGQIFQLGMQVELLTIAAAASSTTTMTLPLNAIILAVSTRVTVVIPTAATFTVTGNTSGTQFDKAGGVAVAAGTTDVGTANCPYSNGAAQTVRITPNLVPAANTGRVRVVIWYFAVDAPTS